LSVIELEDIYTAYEGGEKALIRGLSLTINKGEYVVIGGPNSAGKTTTIRILTTLTKPASGRVLINGFDVAREPSKAKAEFGIVQQHMSLNRDLSVQENLEFHARLHHLTVKEKQERINELLEYVEMREHADQLIDHLSGGQKRRTMIARSLLHRPRLSLLLYPFYCLPIILRFFLASSGSSLSSSSIVGNFSLSSFLARFTRCFAL
jgi:ABC-2 type transport system ATP-binding protein